MPVTHKRALAALIAVALVAGFWTLRRRIDIERSNQTVSVAVDYTRCAELAGLTGRSTASVLRMLRAAGATHTAIREQTLGDLVANKSIEVLGVAQGLKFVPASELPERVATQLAVRIPGLRALDDGTLLCPGVTALELLRQVGVGYPEQAVADARASGLDTIARPIGEMTLTRQVLNASLDAVHRADADVVVFAGLQVLGAYDLVGYAAEQMRLRGIRFGYIEMAKQHGDLQLAGKVDHRIIRCHAVAAAEMLKLSPARAVDRYALAVRERNVRLCYVRPYLLAAEDPVHTAADYVGRITQAIARDGFRTGRAGTYPPLSVGRGALMALLMGAGAAAIWLLQVVFSLPRRIFWGLVAADIVASAAGALAAPGLMQHVAALLAAIAFPTLAIVSVRPGEAHGRLRLWRGLGLFLLVSLVSLCGGLLVAACLSDLPHMMQLATFRGVKLAQLAPLFVVFIVFAARCTTAYEEVRTEMGTGLPEWPALRAGLIEVASAAVRYWHVGLIIIGLGVAAVLLLRSGNVSPMPPSALELQVRSTLQELLVVRPRTKEILFGHPIMILSLAFLAAGRRRGLWVGVLMGAIGQVSLVNTFGHIHTPLAISLVRVLYGLVLGGGAAVGLWLAGRVGLMMYHKVVPRATD